MIQVKLPSESRWDIVSLGEVMLRLDPGDGRIRTARSFRVWEGGGEYNVARGLRRCFSKRAAVVTALVDNDIGRLVEDLILQGGVDVSHVRWIPFDGTGREARVGMNFTERGFGIRGALGVSDRGHTAVSKLKKGEIDWESLFVREGVRWFHSGGIFAALSETAPDVLLEALEWAKRTGSVTSYDLNYRPSLWNAVGGKERAREVNRMIAKHVDVMLGNEEDFTASLGFKVEGLSEDCRGIDPENFKKMIVGAVKEYPNFKAVATTLRSVRSASVNDWGAVLWHDGVFHVATLREHLEIYDRVGGGDSFASGLIYGFLEGKSPAQCVEYGAAHGALAMTTPGDTTMASCSEVEKLMKGAGARVER
jgi:2-dehydro-3-deoxygluconokinase